MGYDLTFNTSRLSEETIIENILAATKDPVFKESEKGAAELIDNMILMKKIETALLNSPALDYRPFTIFATKGKVVVRGYLSSEEEKRSAIKIVESVKGVKSVEADIHVVNYKAYKEHT